MSLFCACARSQINYSPSTSKHQANMSMLRPPSNSKFGFKAHPNSSAIKQRITPGCAVRPVPIRTINEETDSEPPFTASKPNAFSLDPQALANQNGAKKTGDQSQQIEKQPILKKKAPTNTQRPQSTIVTISQERYEEFSDSRQLKEKSQDDSVHLPQSMKTKPSGLRSLLTRPFSRTSKSNLPKHSTGLKPSQSESSGISKRHVTLSNSGSLTSFSRNTSQTSINNASQRLPDNSSQDVITEGKNSPSEKKQTTSSLSKHSQSKITKSLMPKTNKGSSNTKLIQPTSKLNKLVKPSSNQSIITNTKGNKLNHSTHSNAFKQSPNVDPTKRTKQEDKICKPVLGGSERDNTNCMNGGPTSHDLPDHSETVNGETIITHDKPDMGNSCTGGTEKRKPMIEICPLAKTGDIEVDEELYKPVNTTGLLARQRSVSGERSITISETEYNTIINEVELLKRMLNELHHHLTGKQEHEDKLREDIETKDEIIANLNRQINMLQNNDCGLKNGFNKYSTQISHEEL